MTSLLHWILPTPDLNALLLLVLKAVALAAITFLWPRVKTLIAHLLLSRYARYVVPLIQRLYPQLTGKERMDKAKALVDAWLRRWHVPLTLEEIEAAIEAAWSEYKAQGTLSVYAPAKKPAPAEPKKKAADPAATPATN